MSQEPSTPLHVRRSLLDPAADFARLRTEAPVSLDEATFGPLRIPAWLITRHADVREVLGDATTFSSTGEPIRARVAAIAGAETAAQLLLGDQISLPGYDPPDHTRLRRMLTPRFTVRRMHGLRPRIESIVTECLDAMERDGAPADLVQAFALPVPSLVICELLGVPYADRADFQRHSRALADVNGTVEERHAAMAESLAYMAGLVSRGRSDPGDDLLGALIRDHGDELSDEELTALGNLLLLAGHGTTANMLALGTLALLRHPEQLALLRDDPGLGDRAVEELMRYLSIVSNGVIRTATRDITVGGKPIKAGDAVVCSLPSANRDEAFTADAAVLDLTREPTPHVAFGHGIHHCLGAPLARMEMRVAYRALLRRFPGLRLAVPFEEVRFHDSSLHGVEALPVIW